MLYLAQKDIEELDFPVSLMLETVENTFRAKQKGQLELPPKIGVHPREKSFSHAMPGYLADGDVTGLKWINYYPGNSAQGVETINGLIILNDSATGQPLAVMDANWVTAYRTAAVSALSCKLLANRDASSLGLIGYGVQAESHLEIFAELFPLQTVQVWGPRYERAREFAARMKARFDLNVEAVETAEAAVRGMEMLLSLTPIGVQPLQLLQQEWVTPGAVVCPVEFDCAWERSLFQQASRFYTDDVAQFEYYRTKGFFTDIPSPDGELADLLSGETSDADHSAGFAVAVNLGVGGVDIAFAQEIYQRAVSAGIGTTLQR